MNPDRPVETLKQDGFNYYPLAKQLAPHLILKSGEPSLVAGVEAPWGSGKTSFINLTRLALKEIEPTALVLDYCPWVYSTVDSLILGFCIQIASQLSTSNSPNYERISNALLGFSEALRPLRWIPGSEPIMSGVELGLGSAAAVAKKASELKKLDITNAKLEVQKALDHYGKPVIVFIDDVDRLPPQEVRLLFQFLKAVADFNGVSYVVAYDPVPVEQALSYENKLDGKEYLKKFIQLPIRLPRLSRLLMRRFLAEIATGLGESSTSGLSDDEVKDLLSCATSDLVVECLRTPRDVVRCFNLLRLRLPDCHGEILLSELLKYIILDLICPDAIEFVRKHSAFFIGALSTHPEFASADNADLASIFGNESNEETARELFYKSLGQREQESTRSLLESLFPSGRSRSETNVRSAQSSHGLIKLLYGGSSPMAFSVLEAQNFLRGQSRLVIINEKVSAGVFREWVYFLSSLTSGAEISDPCDLASHLIEASVRTPTSHDDPVYSVRGLVADYLGELLGTLTDVDECVLFVESIIAHHESLDISHRVVLSLARDGGLWENGISYPIDNPRQHSSKKFLISNEQTINLEQEWRKAVRAEAANNTLHEQRSLFSILHRWGQFPDNDYSEPQRYIKSFSEKNDALLLIKHSGLGVDVSGLEKLFVAHETILSSLSRYESESEFREKAVKFITSLQAQKKETSQSA